MAVRNMLEFSRMPALLVGVVVETGVLLVEPTGVCTDVLLAVTIGLVVLPIVTVGLLVVPPTIVEVGLVELLADVGGVPVMFAFTVTLFAIVGVAVVPFLVVVQVLSVVVRDVVWFPDTVTTGLVLYADCNVVDVDRNTVCSPSSGWQ